MKRILLLLSSIFIQTILFSQDQQCVPATNGVPAGNEAPGCLFCASPYTGSTAGYTPTAPGLFPCGSIENNQFLSIVPDGMTITGTILASNCTNAGAVTGVQLILYDQSFNPISNCFSSDGTTSTPAPFVASGLTPGEIYWIMIDGTGGDICDIEIDITSSFFTEGLTTASIEAIPESDSACLAKIVTYYVPVTSGAIEYIWEVSSHGSIVSGQGERAIDVEWTTPGMGSVRVSAVTCEPGPQEERFIEILEPNFTNVVDLEFCKSDFPVSFNGQTIPGEGFYMFTFTSAFGCDSIVEYNVISSNERQQISAAICKGESYTIAGQSFNQSGSYSMTVPGAASGGCDSIYELDLVVIPGLTEIAPVSEIDCVPGANLMVNSINSEPSTTFQWSTDTSGNILSGTTDTAIIVGASAEYYLTATTFINGNVCSNTDTVFVPERPRPTAPIFDTISNFHCNLDTGLFVINPISDADSLYWIFENRDTFKTVLIDTFHYPYGAGGFYNLKLAAENVCGIGNSSDTILTVKPIDLPAISLFSKRACVGDTIILKTPKLDSAVTLKWLLDGGDLITTPAPDSFRVVWNISGQKILRLSTVQDGCESDFETDTVQIDAPFSNLTFNCQSTTSDLLFSWNQLPGVDNYSVRVLTGQTGNLVDTTFQVTGLSPNEEVSIEVTVNGSNTCGDAVFTKTCLAQNCPTISVLIDPIADICLNAYTMPIQLTSQISGSRGGGNFDWSGSGITANGLFNPQSAGIGNHIIQLKYSEGSCEYLSTQTIKVNATPTAIFTSISPICLDQTSTLTYGGNATSSANFNWDFNNGNIVTSSGTTNYEINFPASGVYNLSLQVTENGCVSNIQTQTVQVEASIGEPIITCAADADQIIFSWDNLAGATGYDVQVSTGQTGMLSGNNFTVSDLSAGEQVSVLVTAETNSICGNTQSTMTCESTFCPPASILLDATPPSVCEDEITDFQLNLIAPGMVVFDSVRWSGQVVSLDGNINYNALSSGNYSVFAEAYKDACVYQDTFDFQVFSQPKINAKILSPLWYPNVLGGVDLSIENGAPPFDFNWSNGSTTEDISEVNRALIHCVTVTDQNGCEETDCYVIGEGIYRVSPLHVICRGGSKRLSVRPSRGAAFSWSPSDDLSCNDCPNPTASPSKSTVYNVTATMADGRTATTQVIVMVLIPPLCTTLAAQSDSDFEALISNFKNQNSKEKDLPFLEKEVLKLVEEKSIKVVPNPTSGLVRIESFSTIEKVEVFDFSGKFIFTETDTEIDLSDKAKGVYFFKIKTANTTEIKRVSVL